MWDVHLIFPFCRVGEIDIWGRICHNSRVVLTGKGIEMPDDIAVALAQLNPTVGALAQNARKIAEAIVHARAAGADLVVFPEMVMTGYPTNDLLFEHGFVEENERLLETVVRPATAGVIAIVGFVHAGDGPAPKGRGVSLHNSAAVFAEGKLLRIVKKTLLPDYDVFDESRYFRPGDAEEVRPVDVPFAGGTLRIGVQICEDLWNDGYHLDVSRRLRERGAELLVNINASPFYVGKQQEREERLREKAMALGASFVYVNMVGGQDELVFDGRSMVVDRAGRVVARAKEFEEDLAVFRLRLNAGDMT
jgi:NAD+ synthase (glutamine-hydrolysing)